MSRKATVTLTLSLLVALLAGTVLGDEIFLKDGRKFTGKVVSESGQEVKFRTVGGVLTFPRGEVARIEKGRTIQEEYAERREKVDDDDVAGLLALARWCEEHRLVAQRVRIFRALTRKVPNHPEVRREMGQVFVDGEWRERPEDFEEPVVRKGERKKLRGHSFVLPKGWKVTSEDEKGLVAAGPDPWASAPTLSIRIGLANLDVKTQYPEKEGWEEPVELSAAGLQGLRSRRTRVEDGIEYVDVGACVSGPEHGARVLLTTLLVEEKRNSAALDLIFDTLTVEQPPPAYTNEHYRYGLDFPEGAGWDHGEDDEHDFFVTRLTDAAEDYARFWIIAGDPGEETEAVRNYGEVLIEALKATGDITNEGMVEVGGEEAELVEGTFLEDGYPLRMRIARLTHGKRIFLVYFKQHEHGTDRTDVCWNFFLKTFRFLD